MRIKRPGGWTIPKFLRIKQGATWKPAKQVFSKRDGFWFRTADYNPALLFDVYCNSADGNQNSYAYDTIWKGSFVVETGDTLEYEIHGTTPMGGIDIDFGIENMRSLGIADQDGVNAHPGHIKWAQVYGWHKRVFSLNSIVGQRGTSMACSIEDDQPGWHHIYVRNVLLRNSSGQIKINFLEDVGYFPAQEAWYGAGSLYHNYIFQTKVLGDPLNLD